MENVFNSSASSRSTIWDNIRTFHHSVLLFWLLVIGGTILALQGLFYVRKSVSDESIRHFGYVFYSRIAFLCLLYLALTAAVKFGEKVTIESVDWPTLINLSLFIGTFVLAYGLCEIPLAYLLKFFATFIAITSFCYSYNRKFVEIQAADLAVQAKYREQCKPDTWYEAIGNYIYYSGHVPPKQTECEKYKQAMYTTMLWKVPIVEVLVEAFSAVYTLPIEHAAASLNRSLMNLYRDLPVELSAIMSAGLLLSILLAAIFSLLYMFISNGYAISGPLIYFGPAPNRNRLRGEERPRVGEA